MEAEHDSRVGGMRRGVGWMFAVMWCGLLFWVRVEAGDVKGYSVLKGQFLNQVGAQERVLDPDFGFSVLASVDLSEFDLATLGRLRLPDGDTLEMDNLGDYWSLLDSYETLAKLDLDYVWGDYVLLFETVNDGNFSCLVELPERPLPPAALLLNYADVQAADPGRSLELKWGYDAPPEPGDFVQVYVNLGHLEVYSSPNLGEPGALDGRATSVTIPAGVLFPGRIQGLNIEITRIVSTNSGCYPEVEGLGAVFRSTSVDLTTIIPPRLRMLSGPVNGVVVIEVVAEAGARVVLEGAADLTGWTSLGTNTANSGTNVFPVTTEGTTGAAQFFRARQESD